MTKLHSHHTTPCHLGGHDSPRVLLPDYEHAALHAERFLNGDDTWFHPCLLFLLEPEVERLVRQRYSELQTGEGNMMFNVEPKIKGWNWWNNGTSEQIAPEAPGNNWQQGRLNLKWGLANTKGRKWFHNGVEEALFFECPDGFQPGRLPGQKRDGTKQVGKKWWNNGTTETQDTECPGEGFVRGRLPGQRRKRRRG